VDVPLVIRHDLRRMEQIMESKLREATQPPSWRDSITIEPSADPVDTTQQAMEREIATRKLDRHAMIVREIRDALDRIELGNYGVCAQCEESISPKRLAAVPWAALCIDCQEQADGDLNKSADRWPDSGRLATAA
jgi:DnaK suppressor protein